MDLRWHFYVQNLDMVVCEMVCMFLLWTALMMALKGKARRSVAVCAAALSLAAVLFLTILNRGSNSATQISLTPFISFVRARKHVEIYRAMLMNVCLFMPLGLSLPFVLSEKYRHSALITIGFALLLSVGVEAVQFIFRLGVCETDDVIMNVLGASIGTLSFIFCSGLQKLRKNHTHRHIKR